MLEVAVGSKNPKKYVKYILNAIDESTDTIKLGARGKNISLAVDVSQILTRYKLPDWYIYHVKLYTIEFKDTEREVSAIEIILKKGEENTAKVP